MIKSMTGFGRGEYKDEARGVVCEIKSVNHRYLDVSIKLPRRYAFAEEDIRKAVKEVIHRGKVEVGFTLENLQEGDVAIELNKPLARQYLANLKELQEESGLPGEVDIVYLSSLPDVMRILPNVEEEEQVTMALVTAARRALDAHAAMREQEGGRLAEDLTARAETVLNNVLSIEERAPELAREYTEKMKARIRELTEDTVEIPEDRVALEAAIFADKSNITEEIVRLKSHVEQLGLILSSDEVEGKKLDFLIQEMNREANTIGSKANDLTTTNLMLDIKGEVEKIREQVQNIE